MDLVYTTYNTAYKAFHLSHLGLSDHITIMLRPAYRPRVRAIGATQKHVRVWPEGASHALKDCFSTTLWDTFNKLSLTITTLSTTMH